MRKRPRLLFIVQGSLTYVVTQQTLGGIVTPTATVANHPIAGIDAAVTRIIKRDMESVTRSPALEDA